MTSIAATPAINRQSVGDGAKLGASVGAVGGVVTGAGIGFVLSMLTQSPAKTIGLTALGVGAVGALGGGAVGALTGGVLGDVNKPTLGLATGGALGALVGGLYVGNGAGRIASAAVGAGILGAAGWIAGRAMD